METPVSRLTNKLAWTAIVVNLLAIVGGALVRASGSGAGCGDSWPSCQGTVIPRFSSMATSIEFAHRAVSGMALLSVLALFVSVWRNFPKGSQERKAVTLSAIAIVIESLIGAWLVLARLVEDDVSVMRAISVPVHLVNTLFLLLALVATTWLVCYRARFDWSKHNAPRFFLALGFFVILCATGAATALADTLFPAESIASGIREDFSATSHFLSRIRVLHPVIAVFAIAAMCSLAAARLPHRRVPALLVLGLCGVQVVLGFLNIALLTPIALQLVHLLVANLLWMAGIVLCLEPASSQEG